jgi:hypothetical protein
MESCCCCRFSLCRNCAPLGYGHTATSMRSLATSSMLRMTFFSILTSCDSFRARSGPKAPAVFLRNACPESLSVHKCGLVGNGVVFVSTAFLSCHHRSRSSTDAENPTDQAAVEAMRPTCNAAANTGVCALTDSAFSEPAVGLGGGQWRRGVLDLRGGRNARLAHRIGAMHGVWLGFVSGGAWGRNRVSTSSKEVRGEGSGESSIGKEGRKKRREETCTGALRSSDVS